MLIHERKKGLTYYLVYAIAKHLSQLRIGKRCLILCIEYPDSLCCSFDNTTILLFTGSQCFLSLLSESDVHSNSDYTRRLTRCVAKNLTFRCLPDNTAIGQNRPEFDLVVYLLLDSVS